MGAYVWVLLVGAYVWVLLVGYERRRGEWPWWLKSWFERVVCGLMELHTLTWGERQGWSKQLPALAAGRALVLALGGRQQMSRAATEQIAQRYPRTSVCDCSGAGQIFAGAVSDDRVAVAALQLERGHHLAVSGVIERAGESERAGFNTLAIGISCVGRRLVLGERVEEELEAGLAALPDGTQQVGFHGEISPSGVVGCDLHNQTMTLTTISEA